MKTKLLALALLAGGSMFAQTRFSIAVGVGGYAPAYYAPAYYPPAYYPPAPAYVASAPPYPGPGYVWADGYWAPYRGHNRWIAGYGTRRPYGGRDFGRNRGYRFRER